MLKKFFLVSTLLLFFGATYAEPNPNYKGPTYDLSKIQPEFRIGFLGDEAAQDIIARNQRAREQVKHEFVMRNVAKQIDDQREYLASQASKRHEQRQPEKGGPRDALHFVEQIATHTARRAPVRERASQARCRWRARAGCGFGSTRRRRG